MTIHSMWRKHYYTCSHALLHIWNSFCEAVKALFSVAQTQLHLEHTQVSPITQVSPMGDDGTDQALTPQPILIYLTSSPGL